LNIERIRIGSTQNLLNSVGEDFKEVRRPIRGSNTVREGPVSNEINQAGVSTTHIRSGVIHRGDKVRRSNIRDSKVATNKVLNQLDCRGWEIIGALLLFIGDNHEGKTGLLNDRLARVAVDQEPFESLVEPFARISSNTGL
jgi:hypothetical protein